MGNTNYKPLFTGGGGSESIIFTTSKDKPTTGEEGKLYLFTDENKVYWWDKTKNTYKTLGTPSGGRESKPGVTVDQFPYPGNPDMVYIDSSGKKYIWTPDSGSFWVCLGFVQAYAKEEIPPIGIPYFDKPATSPDYVTVLPKLKVVTEADKEPTIINCQIKNYLIEGNTTVIPPNINPPTPGSTKNTLQTLDGYWAAMPTGVPSGSGALFRWYLIAQGIGTPVYQAKLGSYTPVS